RVMIRLTTGSRLHFGLLNLASDSEPHPRPLPEAGRGDLSSPPSLVGKGVGGLGPAHPEPGLGRRFGGVGLVVEQPEVLLRGLPAAEWSVEGPLSERALTFARQFRERWLAQTGAEVPPQRIVIEEAPPEHVGLGTGTQLGLAVVQALAA